ncbi:MAG: DUF1996 domain-containing protein [Actinomycetota bacterium]
MARYAGVSDEASPDDSRYAWTHETVFEDQLPEAASARPDSGDDGIADDGFGEDGAVDEWVDEWEVFAPGAADAPLPGEALPHWARPVTLRIPRISVDDQRWAELTAHGEAVELDDVEMGDRTIGDGARPFGGRLVDRVGGAMATTPVRVAAAGAAILALGAFAQFGLSSGTDDGATAAIGTGAPTTVTTAPELFDEVVTDDAVVTDESADGEADGAVTDDAPDDGEAGTDQDGMTDAETAADGDTPGPPTAGTEPDDGEADGDAAEATDTDPPASGERPTLGGDYASNLAVIQAQTIRNRNEDASPHRDTPSAQLVPENHYGPRSEYLNLPGGNPEQSFPVGAGGQFRVACEFSHFAYDDPLVYPGQPGASHLHMFFGNTDINAFSTADSVKNSGGSTCNGSELNRTGYWVPALFDDGGHVRIPERVVVYYKGEGLANGNAEPFPEGAAMIATIDLNTVSPGAGGAQGKYSFNCSDQYSGANENLSNTMPACDGDRIYNAYGTRDPYVVLEVNVKFPQCWNGQDPTNPANFRHPSEGGWYYSLCTGEFNRTLVNLEYFVNYRLEPGENTSGWYLSSDVSPSDRTLAHTPGSTNHGDWWSGWHDETNRMFIDNCVNHSTGTASGCGFGYLTDGGPDNANPAPGPALKVRDQYTGPQKVAAADLYRELCPNGPSIGSAMAAAYCAPALATGSGAPNASGPAGGAPVPTHSPSALFCPVHRGMLAANPANPERAGE